MKRRTTTILITVIFISIAAVAIFAYNRYRPVPIIRDPANILGRISVDYLDPPGHFMDSSENSHVSINDSAQSELLEYLSTCKMRWKQNGNKSYYTGLNEIVIHLTESVGSHTSLNRVYLGENNLVLYNYSKNKTGLYEIVDGDEVLGRIKEILGLE